MNKNHDKLMEWLESISTDSLRRIIHQESSDYEEYAIEMAREELNKRKESLNTEELVQAFGSEDEAEDFEDTEETLEPIREKIALVSDDELRRMIKSGSSEYRIAVIDIMKEEIRKRNLQTDSHFDKLIDLVRNVEFDEVAGAIRTLYPDQIQDIDKYGEVYATFSQMEPGSTNPDSLNLRNNHNNWTVEGEDATTGDTYGVEFYKWCDWLTFSVKNEQINEIGKAGYLAVCLVTMTQYGYSEDDVQLYFRKMENTNLVDNDPDAIPMKPIITGNADFSMERVLDKIIEFKHEISEDASVQGGPPVRPWVRYFARSIDMSLCGLVLGTLWSSMFPAIELLNKKYTLGYGLPILNFLIWAVIEAGLLSTWGSTPGKWILNIEIREKNGRCLSFEKAIKRVLQIFLFGEGLLIPIVSLVTCILSYTRLTDKGITRWDDNLQVVVTHKKISTERVVATVLILVGITLLIYFLRKG